MTAQMMLPQPMNRNLFLAKQVDQASINDISKSIIAINENDEHIRRVYEAQQVCNYWFNY